MRSDHALDPQRSPQLVLLSAISFLFSMNIGCLSEERSTNEARDPILQAIDDRSLVKPEEGKEDSSAHALFLDFNFEARVKLSSSYWPERSIEQQLLYTIGQLNGDRAVGRLDQLKLSNIQTQPLEDGGVEVLYQAHLIVAWGDRVTFPETYTFQLPYDARTQGLEAFTQKYMSSCVGYSAHDVDSGSMWYYYRPHHFGCKVEEADAVFTEAQVSLSEVNTTGKYPEYNKVWEDGALKVVAIFGKADEEKESEWDAGLTGYRTFYRSIASILADPNMVITPEVVNQPTSEQTEIRFEATLLDGRRVEVTQLLVNNIRTAGLDFDQRYRELSQDADLIVYNGHAGLGANVRALARKGDWVEGQYVIVFMNGCDTYAYVDDALFEAHARVNPDDETGTKYVDIVNNALPSYFSSMPNATLALVRSLLNVNEPLSYEQIFKQIDSSQVVLVTGEADNEYIPGGGGVVEPWDGLSESGELDATETWSFETPPLEAGTYRFIMEGTGDADLYVRIGLDPTLEAFDCRPYRPGS